MRIEKGMDCLYLYGCLEGHQAELYELIGRNCGTNFNWPRHGGERCLSNSQRIKPKGEALYHQYTRGFRVERFPVVVRLADQLHGTFHAQPCRVGHLQAQLACVALCNQRNSPQHKGDQRFHGNSSGGALQDRSPTVGFDRYIQPSVWGSTIGSEACAFCTTSAMRWCCAA